METLWTVCLLLALFPAQLVSTHTPTQGQRLVSTHTPTEGQVGQKVVTQTIRSHPVSTTISGTSPITTVAGQWVRSSTSPGHPTAGQTHQGVRTPGQGQVKLTLAQLTQLTQGALKQQSASVEQQAGTSQPGLTVMVQGQTTGQLHVITQGITIIPGTGQQLMQTALPNGRVQRLTPMPPTAASTTGLSCVSDYIKNISCVWNSTVIAPNVHCRINTIIRGVEHKKCDLEPLGSSLRGCSVVVVNRQFSAGYKLTIGLECGGSQVAELREFKPYDNIKMYPPGVPVINNTINGTVVTWSPGTPLSTFNKQHTFQVQIKKEQERWEEAESFTKTHEENSMSVVLDAGDYQVRVRVRPFFGKSVWSDWSPVSSWGERGERTAIPELPLVLGAVVTVALIAVVLLVLHKACTDRRKKRQHVPDPSKYFHALNSVHGGNFQKWLSPVFAPESFFKAQPCEDISPVEVSEDTVPSTPPLSPTSATTVTSALFHSGLSTPTHGWVDGDISGQSSSSSFFANIGYFLSNQPIVVAHESRPIYFTYQEDHLHPLLWASHSSGSYERLLHPGTTTSIISYQREPQSPDSGFSAGSQDPVAEGKERKKYVTQMDHSPPLLILPLSRPHISMPPTGTAPHPSDLPLVPPPDPELDSPLPPAGSYNAWPVEGTLSRSSSMTMKPSNIGYLTIKELQTTYSNKSI